MRYRDYKQLAPGEYYHIYNRGNEKKDIFLDESDFDFFITKMKHYIFPDLSDKHRTPPLPAGSFSVVSYCLMPNHLHFLIRQNGELSLTKLMLRLCTSYSMYFNKKYDRVGHVFQGRYKLVPVGDNRYLVWLSAYIHQNPKVAGLVNDISSYKWSSYPEFIGKSVSDICDKKIILDQFKDKADYIEFVKSSYKIIKEKKELENLLLD